MPRDLNPAPRAAYPSYVPYSCREDWEDANPGREPPRAAAEMPPIQAGYMRICFAQAGKNPAQDREPNTWVPNRELLEG
jgi:hypothetical protein